MTRMDLVDRAASTLLGLAAVTIAVVVLRREFFPSPLAIGGPSSEPRLIEDWGERAGERLKNRVGRVDAPIEIAVFFDLECPFCARFHEQVMGPFLQDRADDVGVAFIHFPLPNHRFAEPAAEALECAARQGTMLSFMESVYSQSDSLGLKSWTAFATDAGVPDLSGFQACVDEPGLPEKVGSGLAFAEAVEIRGTPTIVVNGWDLGSPPSYERLTEVVEEVRRGGSPGVRR